MDEENIADIDSESVSSSTDEENKVKIRILYT